MEMVVTAMSVISLHMLLYDQLLFLNENNMINALLSFSHYLYFHMKDKRSHTSASQKKSKTKSKYISKINKY